MGHIWDPGQCKLRLAIIILGQEEAERIFHNGEEYLYFASFFLLSLWQFPSSVWILRPLCLLFLLPKPICVSLSFSSLFKMIFQFLAYNFRIYFVASIYQCDTSQVKVCRLPCISVCYYLFSILSETLLLSIFRLKSFLIPPLIPLFFSKFMPHFGCCRAADLSFLRLFNCFFYLFHLYLLQLILPSPLLFRYDC